MQLEIQKFLFDIKTSIDSINEYLGENRDFNNYKANKLLKRGIEREFEIIGEAASRILKIDSNFPSFKNRLRVYCRTNNSQCTTTPGPRHKDKIRINTKRISYKEWYL